MSLEQLRRESALLTSEVIEVTESLLFLVAWALLVGRDRRRGAR
jgi:hypothetical protein